jgi:hypothetical protein
MVRQLIGPMNRLQAALSRRALHLVSKSPGFWLIGERCRFYAVRVGDNGRITSFTGDVGGFYRKYRYNRLLYVKSKLLFISIILIVC